jgi:2,4-dienoyl-CoA reductase-like NADH-dependent reductase (Old Yellow Enzyme family)
MPSLFDPLTMGELSLPNRIVMSPLTRCRASPRRVPNAMMAEYYSQRASAGIIFSEATSVTPMGVGYPDTPGIWSKEQVEGWKQVTRAVHDAADACCCSYGMSGASRTRSTSTARSRLRPAQSPPMVLCA